MVQILQIDCLKSNADSICTRLHKSVTQETQFLKHVVRHLTVTWHKDLSCATE